MKLGKRRYSMNSIAVARGCSCYTMCTCKNRQSLKSYYNIKNNYYGIQFSRGNLDKIKEGGAVMETPPFLYINLTV